MVAQMAYLSYCLTYVIDINNVLCSDMYSNIVMFAVVMYHQMCLVTSMFNFNFQEDSKFLLAYISGCAILI